MRSVRAEFVGVLESTTIAWQTIGEMDLKTNATSLLERITVHTEADFVSVVARAEGPQAAEKLATTHVDKALQYYRKVRSLPAEVSEVFILELLVDSRETLGQAEQDLLDFKLKHKTGSLPRDITSLQDTMRSLGSRQDESRVELERSQVLADHWSAAASDSLQLQLDAQAEVEKAQSVYDEALAAEAAAIEAATADGVDGEIAEITPTQLALLSDAVTIANRALEKHMVDADYYRELARSQEAAVIAHEANATASQTAVSEYGRIIADQEAELAGLVALSAEYHTLELALEHEQDRVSFLSEKVTEATTKKSQALAAGYLQVIEPARTPSSPLPSNRLQLMALGAVVSLVVGTILAFVLEMLVTRRGRTGASPAS